MSRTILLWNMTTDNVPALLDFWELSLSSAKDLKLLYDNHFAKLSIPMQACIMQLLNDSTCRDTDSEIFLVAFLCTAEGGAFFLCPKISHIVNRKQKLATKRGEGKMEIEYDWTEKIQNR